MIQSPLNYTGGKYKLLPQILPLFPGDIRVFVDLFCGGCNVGLNVDCSQVIYNDRNENLFRLYRTFQKLDKERLLGWIYEIIESYGLSLVSRNGYAHYHCDSSKGLGSWNREGYLKLRRDFNQRHGAGERDDYYYVMLYVLIVYAFNNQIRFNADGEFNLPVGKRDFNGRMEQKLLAFLDRIREQDCCFTCCDFRELDTSAWTSRDFVYADPPYLITCALIMSRAGGMRMPSGRFFPSWMSWMEGRSASPSPTCSGARDGKIRSCLTGWPGMQTGTRQWDLTTVIPIPVIRPKTEALPRKKC